MRKLLNTTLLLFAGLFLATAQAAEFTEGKDYTRLSSAQPTTTQDRIEVVELFWYGCPHCYRLEPHIEEWLETRPDDVAFVRMPAVLSPRWELLARAWYTADLLGVTEQIHKPLFNAIHADRQRITSVDQLRDFFVEQGVSGEDFDSTFHSFGVAAKINRAREMTRRYQVRGVPALIINGKYRTSASEAGSHAAMIEVTNHLIEQEREAAGD